MKPKTLGIIALAVALIGLIGGGIWVAKKLHQRKIMRDYIAANPQWQIVHRFELSRDLGPEELEEAATDLEARLERYEVLRPVISELDLVEVWEVADADAAMERLKSSLVVRVRDGELQLVMSDNDKERTGEMLRAVMKSFDQVRRMELQLGPGPPPPATEGER